MEAHDLGGRHGDGKDRRVVAARCQHFERRGGQVGVKHDGVGAIQHLPQMRAAKDARRQKVVDVHIGDRRSQFAGLVDNGRVACGTAVEPGERAVLDALDRKSRLHELPDAIAAPRAEEAGPGAEPGDGASRVEGGAADRLATDAWIGSTLFEHAAGASDAVEMRAAA